MELYPKQLLQQIEHINADIELLEKTKHDLYQKLSLYKKKIESDNSYLIGKKAMCTHIENPKPVECVCSAVIAVDIDYSIKPLFKRNGKKYIVDTYKWM